MIMIEPRAIIRWYHEWIAVSIALLLTATTVSVLLASLGLDPISSLQRIFIRPLNSVYGVSELLAKATPLITIGVALALGFRAGSGILALRANWSWADCVGVLSLWLFGISMDSG